jgi:hypothetical protein
MEAGELWFATGEASVAEIIQGIAMHQEMVIRYLKKSGSGEQWEAAYTEAKIVLESIDRMITDRGKSREPLFRTEVEK